MLYTKDVPIGETQKPIVMMDPQTAKTLLHDSIAAAQKQLQCRIETDLGTAVLHNNGLFGGRRGFCHTSDTAKERIGVDTKWLEQTNDIPLDAVTGTLITLHR